MKKLFCIILAFLLLSGCAATYDGPTESELVLREYVVTHYPFGNENMKYTNRSVYAYDIYGNRVREMEYQDDELQTVRNMKYDDRGNCTRQTTWDHSGWFVRFERRVEQTYDEKGRLTSYTVYDLLGRRDSESRYTYDDEAGTQTWTGGDGSTQTFWLDDNGNVIREVSSEYESVYEYDEMGNRVGRVSYRNGQPYDRYEADFDEKGRLLRSRRYNAQGVLESETVRVYDDEANTCTTRRPGGGVRSEYFDAEGRLMMVEDHDSDGALTMLQQYYYQGIRVPAKGDDAP